MSSSGGDTGSGRNRGHDPSVSAAASAANQPAGVAAAAAPAPVALDQATALLPSTLLPIPPPVPAQAAVAVPMVMAVAAVSCEGGPDGDPQHPLPLPDRDVPAVHTRKKVNMLHETLAGAVGSAVSRFCVAPLDVLKIRFQIQEQAQNRQYTGIMQAFKTIYQKEGIRAFWKGNAAAELMVLPFGAVSFVTYKTCKSWFPIATDPKSPFASYQHLSSLVAGSVSGFCATISTYPLDLLRTRFAAQQQHRVYRSLAHAARHIVEREGVGGLFTGMAPTLIGIVPLMALQFGTYEALKQTILNAKADDGVDPNTLRLTMVEQSCVGFSAGVISKLITMPFDVIKKRFQVVGFEVPLNNHATPAAQTTTTNTAQAAAAQTTAAPAVAARPVAAAAPSTAPGVPAATLPAQSQSVLTHHVPGKSSAPPSASVAFTATPLAPSARAAQSATQLPSAHAQSLTPPSFPSTNAPIAPPPTMQATAAAATASAEAAVSGVPRGKVPAPALQFFRRRRRPHDQPVAGRRPFTGVVDCARGIVAHEGIAGLWKGSIPSILKAGPNSAIIYLVYEYTVSWLSRNFDGRLCSLQPSAPSPDHKFKP